jgi:hypothetical protein
VIIHQKIHHHTALCCGDGTFGSEFPIPHAWSSLRQISRHAVEVIIIIMAGAMDRVLV